MNISRTFTTLASVTALSLVLAACGGGNGSEDGNGSDGGSGNAGSGSSEEGPIRVGGTLALSGPLAATGEIHRISGEQYVEWLNENGGLLGREVEWVLLDDESNPQTSAEGYNRLISQDDVDLLIGPYGTANITAAMNVAERNDMVFPHHSATMPQAFQYEKHFPLFASGRFFSHTLADRLYDAYELVDSPPQSVAIITNENPATHFIAHGWEETPGAVQVAEERGIDVVLQVDYPQGNTDWAPIAQRIKDADPDLLWIGALGGDSAALLTALDQISWQPRHQFHLFPAPGLLLELGDLAENTTSVTLYEPFEPYLSNEGGEVVAERFPDAAAEAGQGYTVPDLQAAISWAAWQTITAGVEGAGSLDQDAIADYLLNNTINTVLGDLDFDAEQDNYYGDLMAIKQLQEGTFYVVYPEEKASEARSIN